MASNWVPSPIAASVTVIDTMARFDGAVCRSAGPGTRAGPGAAETCPHLALRAAPDGYAQVVVVIVRFALAVDWVLAPHAASVSVAVTANQ